MKSEKHKNVLTLSYEEVKDNREDVVREIAKFCGVTVSFTYNEFIN